MLQIAFLFFSRKQTVVRRSAKISRNVFIVHSRPRPGLLCCLLGDSKVLSHEMDFLLQKKKYFHHFYIKVEIVLLSHARRILTAGLRETLCRCLDDFQSFTKFGWILISLQDL